MVAVGVDTHKHEHLARAVDGLGQLLGGLTIRADLSGYIELTQCEPPSGAEGEVHRRRLPCRAVGAPVVGAFLFHQEPPT